MAVAISAGFTPGVLILLAREVRVCAVGGGTAVPGLGAGAGVGVGVAITCNWINVSAGAEANTGDAVGKGTKELCPAVNT